jgi:chemotaxis protein CheD
MPPVAQERFDHIRRLRDSRFSQEIAAIMPGEYFATQEDMIIYTVLGSCISTCVRDPVASIGGMNHFMLPAPKNNGQGDSWGESARYGSFAMELLINEILKRGGHRGRLEVKVFGGARIYEGMNDVGANNTAWVLEYLGREGFKPVSVDTGGIHPRKIYYFAQGGQVLMKRIVRIKNRTIFEREERYQETLGQQKGGEVTLF